MSTTPIRELFQKDVSRQEFLNIAGLSLVSLLGLSSVIHFLTGKRTTVGGRSSGVAAGYGNSSYGQ